jgi:hypothetical protein
VHEGARGDTVSDTPRSAGDPRLTDAERQQFVEFMKCETHTEVFLPLTRMLLEANGTITEHYLAELLRRLWRKPL